MPKIRKPLEKTVQAECIKRLEKRGAYVYRAIANAMAAKGTPDTLCCIDGRFVAIEFKRERDGAYGLTQPQRFRMRQIEQAGGLAFCVAGVGDIDVIVENMGTVQACAECKRPVESLSHTSLNGFCADCAREKDDVPSARIMSAIRSAELLGLTGPDIGEFVREATGEEITVEQYMRSDAFDRDTTFSTPSVKVNGRDIVVALKGEDDG